MEIRDFVELTLRQLVEKPEKVQVRQTGTNHTVVLEVPFAEGEMGYILGRRGQNIDAIRLLASAMARKRGQQVVITVLPDESGAITGERDASRI